MAEPARGRSTSKMGATKAKAKSRARTAKQADKDPMPKSNRDIAYRKLEELTTPILENYGVPAFDELVTRLENTIKEFNDEVDALFTEMVSQSREDYQRMKSILTEETGEEEEEAIEQESGESMSEFEKRLERMEKEKSAKAEKGGETA